MKILLISLLLSLSYSASAIRLVKLNEDAARGDCLPPLNVPTTDALKVLDQSAVRLFTGDTNQDGSRNRVPLRSITDGRLQAVARMVYTINNIGNRRLVPTDLQLDIVFGHVQQSSRRIDGHLQLNPGNQNMAPLEDHTHGGTDNLALIAHEIGHHIGNTSTVPIENINDPYPISVPLYDQYYNAVPKGCNLTNYAANRTRGRVEEFAEVFAAYITNPSLFLGRGPRCASAFQFFAKLFQEREITMSCASRRSSLQRASTPATQDFFRLPWRRRAGSPVLSFPKTETQPAQEATPSSTIR